MMKRRKNEISIDSWYDEQNHLNLALVKDPCHYCNKKIFGHAMIVYKWNVLGSFIFYACQSCLRMAFQESGDHVQYEMVNVVSRTPRRKHLVPKVHTKPALRDARGLSLVDAATTRLGEEEIIDRTVYANRPDVKAIEQVKASRLSWERQESSDPSEDSVLLAKPVSKELVERED